MNTLKEQNRLHERMTNCSERAAMIETALYNPVAMRIYNHCFSYRYSWLTRLRMRCVRKANYLNEVAGLYAKKLEEIERA